MAALGLLKRKKAAPAKPAVGRDAILSVLGAINKRARYLEDDAVWKSRYDPDKAANQIAVTVTSLKETRAELPKGELRDALEVEEYNWKLLLRTIKANTTTAQKAIIAKMPDAQVQKLKAVLDEKAREIIGELGEILQTERQMLNRYRIELQRSQVA